VTIVHTTTPATADEDTIARNVLMRRQTVMGNRVRIIRRVVNHVYEGEANETHNEQAEVLAWRNAYAATGHVSALPRPPRGP
jgi:hypothetical protein